MTRPTGSTLVRSAKQCALVLEGNEVKVRLMAERTETRTPVHVDWVRFTVLRRNLPEGGAGDFEPTFYDVDHLERFKELEAELAKLPDADHCAPAQALDVGTLVCESLGRGFSVDPVPKRGHDFYKHRLSIQRAGVEVGWIGYGASSESPRQQAQSRTLHVNVYGGACTFAAPRWTERMADLIDSLEGTLTRCDLALDFFDGLAGGITRVRDDYEAGLLDVNGQRPEPNMLGNWTSQSRGGRSFYVGSKEAGKQTNFYEKGDQLFGVGQGSKWLRAELRWGNKLRVLSTDMLRRPADFFAAASGYHRALLAEADAQLQVELARVSVTGRLPLETVTAEVSRCVRWLVNVAAPSLAEVFRHGADNVLAEVMSTTKRPGRLGRFSADEVRAAFNKLSTVEGVAPAFV